MIQIKVPLSHIRNNLIYVVAGFGGVVLTSIGGVLVRCVLNRKIKIKWAKEFEKETKKYAESVIQDAISRANRDLQAIKEEPTTVKTVEPITVKNVEPV